MALPSISTPEFITQIPSTGEEIKYRPFLVKEEKILLMAMEGGDANEMSTAMLNILKGCILSDIDVNKLATFDIEYLFLTLRSKSVGEVVTLNVKHTTETECRHMTEIKVNIDDIKVQGEISDGKIMLTDIVGIKLRYPKMSDLNTVTTADSESLFKMIRRCIEYIFDGESVYSDFTEKELEEWVDGLNQSQFGMITKFFENLPKLTHTVEWTCEQCKEKDSIKLEGLQSFFT
jgi:hypothetical protein